MRVIVTGSRAWTGDAVYDALWALYHQHGAFHLMHGACSTGADFHAHDWFLRVGSELGCTEMKYLANWERGPQAGPERNARMVEAGADLVLAFPLPQGAGTQHTMKLARAAGIEVIEFKEG